MATKQTSLYIPVSVAGMLNRLQRVGWNNTPTVIGIAVDRMFWDDKRGFRVVKPAAIREDAPTVDQRIRLLDATQDQIQHFLNKGWPTQTAVIVQAIQRMNADEDYLMAENRAESREAIDPGDYGGYRQVKA